MEYVNIEATGPKLSEAGKYALGKLYKQKSFRGLKGLNLWIKVNKN